MHVLISLVSDGAMAGAAIFRRRALTPSTPVALPDRLASIDCRVCHTVCQERQALNQSSCVFQQKLSQRMDRNCYFYQ